jgi:hypothetical protein
VDREKRVSEWIAKTLSMTKTSVWGCVHTHERWSPEEECTSDRRLDITGSASLVMHVMTQVMRRSSIFHNGRGRIIEAHASTKKTVYS